MNRGSRMMAALLCVIMVLGMIGCSSKTTDTGNSSGKKEVTVWSWDPSYNVAALKEAKAIYEKMNPDVTINVVEMAKADIEQKLNTILASGQKSELPDVVLIEDLNSVKYMESYPNAFVPYDNVDYSKFASSVDFMTVDNQTYGVPFGLATSAIYYRLDYIEQAGYTEADMKDLTWDQFIEIGTAVKEKTGHEMLTLDPSDSSLIRIMLQSAGSWYTDNDGKPNFTNNESLKEAFQTMKKMYDSGMTKKVTGWADYIAAFNNGDVASTITGCWIAPSVMAEDSQSGKWRIAETPRLNMKDSVNASSLGGSSWYVLNGTGNEDAAKDFIAKTFASSTELYDNLMKNNGIASMFIPAFDCESYQAEEEFFGGQKTTALLSEWTKAVPAVNFGTYTWEGDAIISSVFSEVLAGADIDGSLEAAQTQFEAQIQ